MLRLIFYSPLLDHDVCYRSNLNLKFTNKARPILFFKQKVMDISNVEAIYNVKLPPETFWQLPLPIFSHFSKL